MNILITESSDDYELLDSGESEKLERFGEFVLARPDPQALWRKRLTPAEWQKAHATFARDGEKGSWRVRKTMPDKWQVKLSGIRLLAKPTPFKHTGIFPEQSLNWGWLANNIASKEGVGDVGNIEVLNLFGYTGGATSVCAKAGAKVTHVDGSSAAVSWAKENAEASGLREKPIRWICDDVRKFVTREIRRNRKYDGIIMDPPAFGRGAKGELWKIEEDLLPLLETCFSLLVNRPLFFIISGYAAGYSALAYENILAPLVAKFGGKLEIGELAIRESDNVPERAVDGGVKSPVSKIKHRSRILPCGIFARWSHGDENHNASLA